MSSNMQKDFDQWNTVKKEIEDHHEVPFYHEREIWWCSLGVNVGFEQDGSGDGYRRPVLVLKGLSRRTFVAIPLTTATSDHPFRPALGLVDGKDARALLSQMRIMDTKRLVRKIGYLEENTFERIRKAAKDLL